ncbi:MAG: immunoglobulin domain-containing protein, partial [Burkholderiaceae bacterium]
LTVSAPTPLTIAVQPQNVSAGVGQGASFSVTATGGTAAYTYQWRRDGSVIAGATAVSYTTPATLLADSGAGFSVLVRSGSESVTSNTATLTVTATPPVGFNGYYWLAQAGPFVDGTVTFANGVQTTATQALLAVNSASPAAGAVTLEPAGQAQLLFGGALQASISNGQISNLRSRFAAYFKGGRLYRVDPIVTGAGAPTPQPMSSLESNSVCGQDGLPLQPSGVDGNDFAAPQRSWLFLQGPGLDLECGTADDNYRAVRFDMAPVDAALKIGEPQAGILGADGAFTGLVVRNGNQMQRLDANLGNVTNLFVITAGYRNLGVHFAGSTPGIWLFIDAGKLWGVRFSAPAKPVELATLSPGEIDDPAIAADSSGVYVGLKNSAPSFRILRVSETLTTNSTVDIVGSGLRQLVLTPTRLVALVDFPVQGLAAPSTVLQSFLKSGSAGIRQLAQVFSPSGILQMLTSGENVYISFFLLRVDGIGVLTRIIGADGSNATDLDNTDIKRGIAPAVQSLANGLASTYAVVLADGVVSLDNNAGATLRVVEGATRNTLVTYGGLPAAPAGVLSIGTVDPLQYGLAGLWSFYSADTVPTSDLYYFKSDAAGLIRVTNFGTAAPMQSTREQAQTALQKRTITGARRPGASSLPGR